MRVTRLIHVKNTKGPRRRYRDNFFASAISFRFCELDKLKNQARMEKGVHPPPLSLVWGQTS